VQLHFLSLFKICNRTFLNSIKMLLLFKIVQMCDRSFVPLLKSAIFRLYFLSLFEKVGLCKICKTKANFKIALFLHFKKSDHTITLWKNAIFRLYFLSLFEKVGLCEICKTKANFQIALFLHFKKSDHTITLWKRVNVSFEKCKFQNCTFLHIKRAIAHFKVCKCPTLGGSLEKVVK